MVASKTEQTLDKVWLQENLNIHRIQHDCKNNYTKTEYSIVARKTKQKNKYSMVARKYTVFHMLNGLKCAFSVKIYAADFKTKYICN